tara:strand:- start:523 stop:723 length:201 start_codon:yes stop_codon:yes gene_type:complete
MKCGDLVVMRADKLYEPYGKPLPYYLVVERHDMDLIRIHNPITKDEMMTFESDLILISKCKHEKNF